VVDPAGLGIKIRGITYEYAIGQVMAGDTHIYGDFIVAPGVIQPTPRARITGKDIDASELQVFPDPVENTLFLLPAFRQGGKLNYALFDAAGSLVLSGESVLQGGTERQDLPVSHLATGQYILKVSWSPAGATPRTSGYKIQKLR
jgi:hypothetical protein